MDLLFLKFIILLSLSYSFAQKNKNKNCNATKFDENVAHVFGQFGNENYKFPETRPDLSTYCDQVKASNDFSRLYGQNCLKGTSQTLLSLSIYNFDRTNKAYCARNGKKKDDFVQWANCGNKAKPATAKCWKTMMLEMANTKKVTNSKSRVPIICCSYYAWVKCTVKALKEMGSVCPQSSVDGYETHIKKSSVDAMNLICRRYEDNDEKCTQMFSQLERKKVKNLRKTPLLYVFDIFDSI